MNRLKSEVCGVKYRKHGHKPSTVTLWHSDIFLSLAGNSKAVRLFRLKIPIMTFVEKNDFDRISDNLQTGVAIVVSNFGKKIY